MRFTLLLAAAALCTLVACAHGETGVGTTSSGAGGGAGSPGATSGSASSSSGAGTCGGEAAPTTPACCQACVTAGKPCQANGCYNGYLCNPGSCKCSAPPTGC